MKREMKFDNFHIYEGNKIAYLAAQKIIEFPGELFNPLYIHGCTGIGKTHITWALFNAFLEKGEVLFFTSKDFEQHLMENKPLETPLIVDDIHSIEGSFHEKLLSIIDRYLTNNIQLCFTGNAAPRDLKNFNDKIISRLEGGLVCDIQPPKEMALVDLIKKKSSEAGILLPDEVALELAQISTGSIRTIEGMINRLVAYSSLGNVTLDVNTVHMILKEFYPKGIYSPVSSLLEELKKNASEVLQDVSTKLDIRDEYRERIYVWQMKGFDTTTLTNLLDGDAEVLKREYDTFISIVERLIDLQKQYGALDLRDHPDEAMKIESMLFSPEKVDKIEELIKQFAEKPVCIDKSKSFDGYISGPCTEKAIEIYQKQVRENLGERYNPFVVFGDKGVGKTRFLEAIFVDLEDHGKTVYFCDCESSQKSCTWDTVKPYDAIILDNFHAVMITPEPVRKVVLEVLQQSNENHKAVIISVLRTVDRSEWGDDVRQLFEMGIEVEILPPDAATVMEYIEPRLTPMQYEQALSQGIPEFKSFPEIEAYVTSLTGPPQEVILLEPVAGSDDVEKERSDVVPRAEVADETAPVSLGLPGEEKQPDEQRVIKDNITPLGFSGEPVDEGDAEMPPEEETGVAEVDTENGDIVTLGLPGEDTTESPIAAAEVPVTDEGSEKSGEKPDAVLTGPLKKIHEERFIIHDVAGELIEDNY